MENLTKKCTAKLYRHLVVIGLIKRSKHVMTGTNEELSYQYVVIFITDLEFAITLVFKKLVAILTSTSTIDINVPTSETRNGSSMKQKDSIASLVHKFS